MTEIPVLVGFAPGVTVAVRVVCAPGSTEPGVAAPLTLGLVGVGGPPHVSEGARRCSAGREA